jgi:hypothetical protein
MPALYHGGAPGLRVGDLIVPGHQRATHPGCSWCAARAELPATLDGLPDHPDRVYATTSRLYAQHYASLYGRGDLYRVEPVDDVAAADVLPSTEDTVESVSAPAFRIAGVLTRAVRLTPSERRRLQREWKLADDAAAARRTEVTR